MQQYYQGTFITISALSATGSHEGFLKTRTQKQVFKLHQENLYLRPRSTYWYTIMNRSPLAKRGWILQEQLLSTRIVHFGEDEMVWQCQTCTKRESHIAEVKAKKQGQSDFLQGEIFKPILSDIQYLSLPPFEAMTRWFMWLWTIRVEP
jgi:hypothetical protein